MSGDQFLTFLSQRGIGPDTLRNQLRAQISWGRWIRGSYGSRLRIGDDQIAATQARLAAEATKPQYNIGEVLIDAKGVSRLYNPGLSVGPLFLFLGAFLVLVVIVVLSSPALADLADLTWLKLKIWLGF